MAANPDATSALQAPAAGPTDKERAALAFILRAEAGRLPEFPKGVYPNIRFAWDGRDGHNRLLIRPRAADCDLRRLYRDFIHEHNAELKTVCRLRQESEQTADRVSAPEAPEARILSPGSVADTTSDARIPIVASRDSRSDLRKESIRRSDSVTPETYGAKTSDSEPEVYVEGYRLTEHDVKAMLSTFGDEALAEFESGKLARRTAYRQAQKYYRDAVRIGIFTIFRASSTGRVLLHPEPRILRAPSATPDPSTSF